MIYSVPPYIAAASIDSPIVNFIWDDTRVDEDFLYDPGNFIEKMSGVSLRGKIAVGIGMFEWVACRFASVSEDLVPFQILEAAWCANVRREYMEYFELDRDEWLGPIRGPLWCGITWLMPMIFFSDDDPAEWESGLSFLSRLAVHVLPSSLAFEDWLNSVVARMKIFYPLPDEDPFEDLFGENEEERRGPLVPKEVLNPEFEFKPDRTDFLIDRFLKSLAYHSNPFLKTPELMLEEGFLGIPYRINQSNGLK
ncbi:MAG: hypothetical protein AB7T38_17740 [Nitrospirales bacterium]